jgi:hypothetical protein
MDSRPKEKLYFSRNSVIEIDSPCSFFANLSIESNEFSILDWFV